MLTKKFSGYKKLFWKEVNRLRKLDIWERGWSNSRGGHDVAGEGCGLKEMGRVFWET